MSRTLGHLSQDERLEELGLEEPGEEKVWGRLSSNLSVPKGSYKIDGDRLFSRACCEKG